MWLKFILSGLRSQRKRKNTEFFFMILQLIRYAGIHLPQIDSDMKKRLCFILFIIGGLLLPTSCETSLGEPLNSTEWQEDKGKVNLRLSGAGRTRSSISPDEGQVNEICVMVYRKGDGVLVTTQSARTEEEIGFELTHGDYNIYVTANMGIFDAPSDESCIKDASYEIGSFEGLEKGLPMSWSGQIKVEAGTVTTIHAKLERLVSKVGFTVEMGVLEGLEITSVRLHQGAGTIRPFMPGGSRIINKAEAMDGDYATAEDIASLMNGGTMHFYVTENCQGTLLPGNIDPWHKVPDSIGNSADLCTYVEMKGVWNERADYEGEVTYRFYLGEDASGNFDIRRNSLQDLTLYLEEDSFDRISWKIDASRMDIARWTVTSDLSRNFHAKTNFYITEKILIEFQLDERGQRYWKKRNNAFSLVGMDNGNNTLVSFKEPTDLGNGRFQAMGTCIGKGDFDILMINDQTGELEYIMDYGTVKVPDIVAGREGSYSTSRVEALGEATSLTVNGQSASICLYLTDSNGYNLNQSRFYGCDFSICEWMTGIYNNKYRINLSDKFDMTSVPGRSMSDGYAIKYTLGVRNDGMNDSWNERLIKSLGKGLIRFWFDEMGSRASGEHYLGLYCDDISVTFRPVPESQKPLLMSEFMYEVDNPSNFPLLIRGLKLNSLTSVPFRSDIRPIIYRALSGHTCTTPLLISRMPYAYCSLESNAEGAAYTRIDGKLCFAADDNGIEQDDIPNQMAMFHNLEVAFGYKPDSWVPEFTGRVNLYDTESHDSTYGAKGFLNCGMAFHAYQDTYKIFDANNGLKTDFKGYGALLDKESVGKFDEIITVDIGINADNQIIATASQDIELEISISGTLTGHIRCVTIQDPFFTVWGHYFTHNQNFDYYDSFRLLASTPTVIDGSSLAEAFSLMRNEPYYSKLDIWEKEDFRTPGTNGSVREYLKPVSIDINIDIESPDNIPVAIRFSGSTRYDYKTSGPVTWTTGLFSSVTMVPSSYSGFDNRLDDDDCPPGALFAAETLYIQPTVTFSPDRHLYYMTR